MASIINGGGPDMPVNGKHGQNGSEPNSGAHPEGQNPTVGFARLTRDPNASTTTNRPPVSEQTTKRRRKSLESKLNLNEIVALHARGP